MNTVMDYETWVEEHDDELYILAYEMGYTTEPEYDAENFALVQYEEYLRAECFHCNFQGTSTCYNCPAEGSTMEVSALLTIPAEALTEDDSDIPF